MTQEHWSIRTRATHTYVYPAYRVMHEWSKLLTTEAKMYASYMHVIGFISKRVFTQRLYNCKKKIRWYLTENIIANPIIVNGDNSTIMQHSVFNVFFSFFLRNACCQARHRNMTYTKSRRAKERSKTDGEKHRKNEIMQQARQMEKKALGLLLWSFAGV